MRSKVVMVLAIVMGLITTFLFYNYIETFQGTPETELKTIETLVAKRDIKRNERISADMVVKVQVAENGLYGTAIADSAKLVGKYALADIAEGEPFLPHRVLDEKEERLFVSRKIKENYRAVSIGTNFVQSVSNLIEPGDYVDVIFTKLGKPEQGTVTESQIILNHVRVLAAGRRMVETVEGEAYVEYSSATLELNAQETVKAVNAYNDGIITLTLHSRIKPNNDLDESGEGKINAQ